MSWAQANQRSLVAAIATVREVLRGHAARSRGEAEPSPEAPPELEHASAAVPSPAALDTLCAAFGLSPFERDIVLLCAGAELDASFGLLCADAQGDATRPYPTFGLALATLPGAHWSALAPGSPLRRWRLVDVSPAHPLAASPLRIDERILHYLAGVNHLDERLAGIVDLVTDDDELVPSHEHCAARLAAAWGPRAPGDAWPVVQLCGDDAGAKAAIVAAACRSLGMTACVMPAGAVPAKHAELEELRRLWEREAALGACALIVDVERSLVAEAARLGDVVRFVDALRSPVALATGDPLPLARRVSLRIDVSRPAPEEQEALWSAVLGPAANGGVREVSACFDLGPAAIRSVGAHVRSAPDGEATLWDACRVHARPRLDDLAQRIEPAASWDDLVLPGEQGALLREIAAHCRHRATVYRTWGFARPGTRGLGISALFTGASGTGKTMAAEVLAGELRLDLYRIDLSSVVSKYIGETEKNLRRVFDAAEQGGAILLFDEADALFGRRSEVKDSHDRYANIEVSYLLQRMEAYRGLAILTTNLRGALDPAFVRRIRFIVDFPFPDSGARAEIWRRIFPPAVPTRDLDPSALAGLNVSGGSIRNIALNAAFLAADEGSPVGMAHLLRAARTEYAKLETPLAEAEIGGWR